LRGLVEERRGGVEALKQGDEPVDSAVHRELAEELGATAVGVSPVVLFVT
jgi:ADP-ribose pyrophosphatase YjhB (NUDIX family)